MIPKIIHYCWLGGNPLPESAKKCIKSWKKYCPDYQIIEWNESNYDFTKNPYMKQAYEAKKWGFVPDYARLDIIYTYGGIYLDTDVEMIRPYDDLLKYKGFAGFESEHSVALGLGFGAEAGNPIIKKLMDSYETMSFLNQDGSLNLIASPEPNSVTLSENGLHRDGTMQTIDGFVFLPAEYLCPKSFYDGIVHITDNTYSVHQFDASWMTKEDRQDTKNRWKKKQRKLRKRNVRRAIKTAVIRVIGERLYRKLRGSAK